MLLFSSCSLNKPLEFKKVNSFKVEQKKGGARIKGNVTLYNPNSFNYKIQSIDINVYIEGQSVGKLVIPNQISVNKKSNFSGDCYIDVGFAKALILGANLMPKVKDGGVNVQLKGDAQVKFFIFNKSFKIDKTELIKL